MAVPISQRQPENYHVYLGFNTEPPYTIYMYGCALVSIAMIAEEPNVIALNKAFMDVGGFVVGGFMVWQKIHEATIKAGSPKVVNLVDRTGEYPFAPLPEQDLQRIYATLRAGTPVLIEVNFYPWMAAQHKIAQHFVVAIGIDGFDNITIYDPWDLPVTGKPLHKDYATLPEDSPIDDLNKSAIVSATFFDVAARNG